eukprot:scaffold37202_cov47-Prasinocladus_malaysianus.AAC.1
MLWTCSDNLKILDLTCTAKWTTVQKPNKVIKAGQIIEPVRRWAAYNRVATDPGGAPHVLWAADCPGPDEGLQTRRRWFADAMPALVAPELGQSLSAVIPAGKL